MPGFRKKALEIFKKSEMPNIRYFEIKEDIFNFERGFSEFEGNLEINNNFRNLNFDKFELDKISSYSLLGNANFLKVSKNGEGKVNCSGMNYLSILIENGINCKIKVNCNGFTFLDVICMENSNLDLKVVCKEKSFTFRKISLIENSNAKINTIFDSCITSYSKVWCHLQENSKCEINELFIAKKNNKMDLSSSLIHEGRESFGRMNVKGITFENSVVVVRGLINIFKGAKRSDSLQNIKSLCFDNSRCHAFPCLEIRENDVKATHKASVYNFTDQELFYLRSRGLEENKARGLMISGFLNPMIERMGVGDEVKIL